MKHVLGSGATGDLGGFLSQELAERGYGVRAPARSPERLERLPSSIHENVLAVSCVDAIEEARTDFDVGGPEVLTRNEVARPAFEALDRPAKISHRPEQLLRAIVPGIRLVDVHRGELSAFVVTMATTDVFAPAMGTRTLIAHPRTLGEKR